HSQVARPARASWMASAVPQEPAPRTPTVASCLVSTPLTRLASMRLRALTRVFDVLLEQGVEVERLEQELREAAFSDEIRHGLARVREDEARAVTAQHAPALRLAETL